MAAATVDQDRRTRFDLVTVFGTAYMPRGKRPSSFGIRDPVPQRGYLQHLAYPFTAAARTDA